MRVLYDHQIFCSQKFGGISTYFYEILNHLPSQITPELSLVEATNVCAQSMGYPEKGKGYQKTFFPNEYLFKTLSKIRFHRPLFSHDKFKINEEYSKYLIRKGEFDVFHPTYFEKYYLDILPPDKPLILTIHDLIPEIFSDLFPGDMQSVNRPLLIERADHIIAVSENTKQDIIRIYNVPEEKISVIYHGVSETPYIPSPGAAKPFPYVLYVGTRCHYKNFTAFCNVIQPVLREHSQLKLVCTGQSFTEEEKDLFCKLGIQGRVENYFCQTQQELMDLYHNAVCFVYPSLYEGFGIPILEAYKAQCPVMLNKASCFPEIAGNAAVYFSIKDDGTSDFSEKFEALYNAQDMRRSLIELQDNRLSLYPWIMSARRLAEVYETVVSRS